MKLEINTDLKTIKLEEGINLGKFFEAIKIMLPDFEDYKLETNTTINWNAYPRYYCNLKYYNPLTNPLFGSTDNPYKVTCYTAEVQ